MRRINKLFINLARLTYFCNFGAWKERENNPNIIMNTIRTIQGYKDLFDDEPQSIDSYLSGIDKTIMIDYAINYCSLSTIVEPDVNNIFWAFLNKMDVGTEFYNALITKVSYIVRNKKEYPIILNIKTSLKFFELVQGRELLSSNDLSDYEIRQRLLKVYLLLNSKNKTVTNRENFIEQIVEISLRYSIYSNTNCLYLRITELIKSCLFLEYCKENIPDHFDIFLKNYGINKWQEYTLYLHQIGNIIFEKDIEDPVKLISIPIDDLEYAKKTSFFDEFCMQETYQNDADFTKIKSQPVVKNNETGEYRIVFEQFFIEKMYKSLYFTFKEINDSFKDLDKYINPRTFRSNIGLNFSEKVLMNRILKDALGNKYKQLNHEELPRDGSPDYYTRDGKYILLFECKDNLINKKVVDNGNINEFIDVMKGLFISNKEGKPKAIKQLINNIISIRKGEFVEDKGINLDNNVIYPILITHNSIFSLSGINALIDEWFSNELDSQNVVEKNIKHLTLININTLILYQGLIAQKGNSIRELIDSYWKNYLKFENKKYPTVEAVVNELPIKFQSFDSYVENVFKNKNIITKGLLKYDQCFQ
jgi:hypothetical protein